MGKKTFSVKDVQKMVKSTMKKNDWNNGEFADHVETTRQELSKFMKDESPMFAPMKIIKAFGLKKKVEPVKYINEGE
jgi:hypothetical protein